MQCKERDKILVRSMVDTVEFIIKYLYLAAKAQERR